MNRSLRLLRPLSTTASRPAANRLAGLHVRPTPLSITSYRPATLSVPSAPSIGARLYVTPSAPLSAAKKGDDSKTGKSGAGEKASANPLRDDQNVTTGAVEEVRAVVRDVADMISGRSANRPTAFGGAATAVKPGSKGGAMAAMETTHGGGDLREDFSSITRGIVQAIPEPVRYFGLLGTVPYISTALGTVFFAREASRVQDGLNAITGMDYSKILSTLHTLEEIQITYGAVILSFLGALHWGFEFAKYGGEAGYTRLAMGTLPVLFAWPTTFLSHGVALAVQWTAFTFTWFLDQRASSRGWTPEWFATYRFYLSIIVGFSIIGTLAGTSHYGMGAGAGLDPTSAANIKTLDDMVSDRKNRQGMRGMHQVVLGPKGDRRATDAHGGDGVIRGKTKGDVYVEEEEGLEAYGRLRNKAKLAEAEEEEEEEEEGEGEEGAAGEGEDAGEEGADKEESGGDDSEGDGRSQQKKDNPDEKGAAGEKLTAKK